jgi:hypothetical protein
MKSSVIVAALAASFVGAEPEASAEPEPLPFPAPQRQIGAILGILGMLQPKNKAGTPKGGQTCSCSSQRSTDAYCKNNNEAGPSRHDSSDA